MYTLYTNYSDIWSSPPYNFDTVELAISYLAPAAGFIMAACIIVPYLDKVYTHLSEKWNDGEGKPEYRLPFANVGAVFLPISLFWFGWTVEFGKPWPIPLSSMLLFGASQVVCNLRGYLNSGRKTNVFCRPYSTRHKIIISILSKASPPAHLQLVLSCEAWSEV